MNKLVFALSLFTLSASAQAIFFPVSTQFDNEKVTVKFNVPDSFHPRVNVVTGAPYTADQVSEHTQTLADGTHITQNRTAQHMVRDSQGRTRIERPPIAPMFEAQNNRLPLIVEIQDPVAGCVYVLDDQNRIAHRIALPQQNQNETPVKRVAPKPANSNTTVFMSGPNVYSGSTGAASAQITGQAPAHAQFSQPEHLGTQNIEGVMADGTRRTTTWPIGSRGNDRPIVETNETWYSQELKLMVLSKNLSPLNGNNIMRLTNISTAEPDPGLFQPTGYTIVDESGSFEMTLKRDSN